MHKKTFWVILFLAILIGAAYYMGIVKNAPVTDDAAGTPSNNNTANTTPVAPVAFDAQNGSYVIDDARIKLVNGEAESPVAAGSAMTITTEYFGNEASGDLNGDGIADSAFLLTQYGAGTGIFFYAVAVLKTTTDATVTNTVFLGDRIGPQSTEIRDGHITVNYTDRKPGEPMTEEPTVATTKTLSVTSAGELTE